MAYRNTKASGIEILLITTRGTGRWIIPKGWPIKGLKPSESAAREAYEEAGVRGTVSRRPLGSYTYDKHLEPPKIVPCEVKVYALRVRRSEETWPESGQRELRWCKPEEAVALAEYPELGAIIRRFAVHLSTALA